MRQFQRHADSPPQVHDHEKITQGQGENYPKALEETTISDTLGQEQCVLPLVRVENIIIQRKWVWYLEEFCLNSGENQC